MSSSSYLLLEGTDKAPSPPKPLHAFGVAVICFASVAGGPFGIEPAVGAAGGLPTMVGLVFVAAAWACTQALMTAELATMIPCNAGYIGWVYRGLGPRAAFVNAWVCNLQQLLNMPLYAVIACNALEQLVGQLPAGAEFGCKLAVVAIALAVNLYGVGAVERVTGLMIVLVQTPFVAMPILWATGLGRAGGGGPRPFAWAALGTSVEGWSANTATFISTLCWNMQGWTVLGNVGGEVHNPRRAVPLGVALALAATLANYVWPLLPTIAMSPPPSPPDDPAATPNPRWGSGYFVSLASAACPGLGVWTAVCAVLSCITNFIPQLATGSRALQATARMGMVPGPAAVTALLSWESPATGTPTPCVLAMLGAVCGLMLLNFSTLVTTQILLALVALGLQFGAFLRLKLLQPEAPRPYAVPGGLPGAVALATPFFLLAGLICYCNAAGGLQNVISCAAVAATTVLLAVVGELWWVRHVHSAEAVEAVLMASS